MALSIPLQPKIQNKKILVIDDDKPVSDLFRSELEKIGYEVSVAQNGEEGLKSAKAIKPKLIILDLIMPRLGGREFLEKIRTEKSIFSIPIIVVSHLESDIEKKKCQELGAVCYIVKHKCSVNEIINKIREILEKQ